MATGQQGAGGGALAIGNPKVHPSDAPPLGRPHPNPSQNGPPTGDQVFKWTSLLESLSFKMHVHDSLTHRLF